MLTKPEGNSWRSVDTQTPRNIVIEGVNQNGIRCFFILCDEPDVVTVRRKWLFKKEEQVEKGGTFIYLALPSSRGYARLSSRTSWQPTHWRYVPDERP